jgi:hypothetical protein
LLIRRCVVFVVSRRNRFAAAGGLEKFRDFVRALFPLGNKIVQPVSKIMYEVLLRCDCSDCAQTSCARRSRLNATVPPAIQEPLFNCLARLSSRSDHIIKCAARSFPCHLARDLSCLLRRLLNLGVGGPLMSLVRLTDGPITPRFMAVTALANVLLLPEKIGLLFQLLVLVLTSFARSCWFGVLRALTRRRSCSRRCWRPFSA